MRRWATRQRGARRASVGCAVRTGWISVRASRASTADRSRVDPDGDGLADGYGHRPSACAARPRAQDADPLTFLGEVDQLEVDRERLGDGGERLEVEGGDLRGQPGARSASGPTAGSASPRRTAIMR